MKRLNRLFVVLLTAGLLVGCGGGDSKNDESNSQQLNASDGKCLPLIIEKVDSGSEFINEYKVTSNANDIGYDLQNPSKQATIRIRSQSGDDILYDEAISVDNGQLQWKISIFEQNTPVFFTRSDKDCEEEVVLEGTGKVEPIISFEGTYKGNVSSSCQETIVATVNVDRSNIITGTTTDDDIIKGHKIDNNKKILGTSSDGVTWKGEMVTIRGIVIMNGTWRDTYGCGGTFYLSEI